MDDRAVLALRTAGAPGEIFGRAEVVERPPDRCRSRQYIRRCRSRVRPERRGTSHMRTWLKVATGVAGAMIALVVVANIATLRAQRTVETTTGGAVVY